MGFRIGNEFIGNDKVFYKSESSMTKLKIGPKNGAGQLTNCVCFLFVLFLKKIK